MSLKRGIIHLKNPPSILGFSAVAGDMEQSGPLSGKFDKVFKGDMDGEKSFEKAESKMQLCAAVKAIEKANLKPEDIEIAFAGDLLNQCIGTNYGLRELGIPFAGVYGACSTMAESIVISSVFISSGQVDRAIAVTSSHFCASERQFRFPLEYGGQRPPTAQWTATAAGAIVLGKGQSKIKIKSVGVGRIIDYNIKDMNNMGAAMAPAAVDTIVRFLEDTNTTPKDYDLILTGDLGQVGSSILSELMKMEGYPLEGRHSDCGMLLFDRKKQDVHAGGSGCGCSAAVLCADVLDRMNKGNPKKVLFIATGALMSPTSNQQGESIPGVAHLVLLEGD
ncbi:MAG: stage V sporulation protein AD [Oscillospiraceae bacterium]|nr:stage V sporulation protein AD [Oscillospiraceae bacterium]